jgi:hypothetical protein
MDLKAGPAQVIAESRWLKNWGSQSPQKSSRWARRQTPTPLTRLSNEGQSHHDVDGR